MSAAVGADIESICRKCGDVWHVVVAMDGDKIVKVLCKQCNNYHRYKPPGGTPKKSKSGVGKRTTSSKKQTVSVRFDEPQVQANVSKPVMPYKFSAAFEPGDRISHPKFGEGVVELNAPGKMQVFFPEGRRWLALAKKKSDGLERPKPFQHNGPRKKPQW